MHDMKALRAMSARNPVRDMGHRSISATRRQLLAGMGAAAALAATGVAGRVNAASRPLNMLTWDAYADPRLLDMWRDKSGSTLKTEIHISDPTSVNRLRAGETNVWDLINVNNPWARTVMWPNDILRELPRERFEPLYNQMFEKFKPPYHWAMSADGDHLLGVVQRMETFDFVVNSDVIAPDTAKKEGWDLFNNPDFAQRYGILAYDDWVVMDICMGAGLHPYKEKSDAEIAKFEETAKRWINNAKLITTDFVQLNLAMLNGEIDMYFCGGTYSISSARLEGATNLHAITPHSGPADGKGGINWIELNSAINNPDALPEALDFLEWITEPEPAYIVANGNGNLQPVAQMAQEAVMSKFTPEQLDAIQWDEFDERISHAIEFDIVPDYDKLFDIYSAATRERG